MARKSTSPNTPAPRTTAVKTPPQHPISKLKLTGKQIRIKIFENIRARSGWDDQRAEYKYARFVERKNKCHIKQLIRQQQVTCSICYDIMVAPTLVDCGHLFCLSCLDRAYFANSQCPLCRKPLQDGFNTSSQIQHMVRYFVKRHLNAEERLMFDRRDAAYKIEQLRRALPSDLAEGSFVDFNNQGKWRSARIIFLSATTLTLYVDNREKTTQALTISRHSRRLAKHRTFTKAPPLKPVYFSKHLTITEPGMQLIVEAPGYYPRQLIYQAESVVSSQCESRTETGWDQFETIDQGNSWMFTEEERIAPAADNFWNLLDDDLEMPLFT